MAKKTKPVVKLPRRHKTAETIRERADKQGAQPKQPKGRVKNKIYRPLSFLRQVAQKEYNPIKVPKPKSKWGKILGKRVHIIPVSLKNAWAELRQVSWPPKKLGLKLTLAVVVFAVIFAIFVQIFGFLFERLFKYILST